MTSPSFSGSGARDAREVPVARQIGARDAVRAALAGVRPLVSQSHEGLTLLILEPRALERLPGSETGTGRRWLTFAEAALRGVVRVQEAAAASVPSVVAEADGVDVLLLDGDTIVGGLQNRIVNVSIWLKAGVPTNIPVSCLEQGRWRDGHDLGAGRSGERDFAAGQRADPSLRAMVGAAVNAGVGMDRSPMTADRHGRGEAGVRSAPDAFAADQDGVWLEIEARQQRARSAPPRTPSTISGPRRTVTEARPRGHSRSRPAPRGWRSASSTASSPWTSSTIRSSSRQSGLGSSTVPSRRGWTGAARSRRGPSGLRCDGTRTPGRSVDSCDEPVTRSMTPWSSRRSAWGWMSASMARGSTARHSSSTAGRSMSRSSGARRERWTHPARADHARRDRATTPRRSR